VPDLRIPMDPENPGQFFACCGLFELVARTAPSALARFEADEATPRRAEFVIAAQLAPELRRILEALRNAKPEPLVGGEESIRPILLNTGDHEFVLDWWLDYFREKTTNLKCWAGQVTTRKLFDDLMGLIDADIDPKRLMTTPAMTKSKFGVDPRSAWNALDFGSSPDARNKDAATYPAVEVLAAIGLQGFRPVAERRDSIAYYLWTVLLPLSVARAAAVNAWDGLPRFEYRFSIEKRGQSYKYFKSAQFIERKDDI
jgi:CRISPR-associated protein Csx14